MGARMYAWESAKADFAWFQRRIHSLLEGGGIALIDRAARNRSRPNQPDLTR
jgi:hypothetical protein